MKMIVELTKISWILNHILKVGSLPQIKKIWTRLGYTTPKPLIEILSAVDLPDIVD